MQIDVMLEPDQNPQQLAELALMAEGYGLRALYEQNYVNARDPFMALVPAAQATSKIQLGVCVVSPYEMHPMRIGNALLSLNEFSGGRAEIVIGGGGAKYYAQSGRATRNNPFIKVYHRRHGFCLFEVQGEKCLMRAIDIDGEPGSGSEALPT